MASVEEPGAVAQKEGWESGRHCCVFRELLLPFFLTNPIHILLQVGMYLSKILAFPDYSKGVDFHFRPARHNEKSAGFLGKFCFAASGVVP